MFMRSVRELRPHSFPVFRVNTDGSDNRILTGQLSGLLDGETKYIYHHLRSGSILSVKQVQQRLFEVFFGSHQLGRLNPIMSNQLTELQRSGFQFRLTIGSIIREKYLPPSAIELELEWVEQELEKVA